MSEGENTGEYQQNFGARNDFLNMKLKAELIKDDRCGCIKTRVFYSRIYHKLN